eukprot:2073259-Prorocentrum_lima.AAC.1
MPSGYPMLGRQPGWSNAFRGVDFVVGSAKEKERGEEKARTDATGLDEKEKVKGRSCATEWPMNDWQEEPDPTNEP